MVMVSGRWVRNVVYPSSGDLIDGNKMAAKAVLICRPNSHPFQRDVWELIRLYELHSCLYAADYQDYWKHLFADYHHKAKKTKAYEDNSERSLTLDQPVKIGRSVARARAAPNNAIFDCKVLSRNHALLWYENGKFYLQDTKSSNGTFVNNQRLSKGAEESPPREVCSGDIVQFGVDVMENSRKVTHGCIVATLKLYLPDGKEAKASPSTSVVSSVGMVPLEDLYQLNQYLQEALQREQLLENKLATLQRLVESTRQATDMGWKALIDEDRLLSRVEILENQLQMYSKNFAEDKLREELRKLQEDKCQYQGAAKESLRKILQEKLETVQKLQDLERTLSNTEDECAHLKELCERSQQDLQELALKYSQQLQKVEDLSSKLQETEEQNREVCERLEQEKQELQARLQEQLEAERALQLRLEVLQADGDHTQRQLQALQTRLHALQLNDDDIDTKQDLESIKAVDSTGTQVDIILERIEPGLQDNMKEAIQNTQEEIETLLSRLKTSEEELKERHAKVDQLHHQVELTQLDGKQRESEITLITVQLEESRFLEDKSSEHIGELLEQKEGLELQLNQMEAREEEEKTAGELEGSSDAVKLKAEIIHLEEKCLDLRLDVEFRDCMVTLLKELLAETRDKKHAAELQKQQYQLDLDCAKLKEKNTMEEVNLLKQQLQAAQSQMREKSESVSKLHEQMQWLETSADEVKLQALTLQEQLFEEQQRSSRYLEESENLRKQLMEAQQCAKQSHNEAEQMKDRLKAAQEEYEMMNNRDDNRNQEEYARLRQRCHMLEEDNARLKEEYRRLAEQKLVVIHQETARPPLRRGDTGDTPDVPDNTQSILSELAACRQERDQMSHDIHIYQEELVTLKERYAQCSELKAHLTQELNTLREEYSTEFSNTRFVIWCSLLPLVIVFLGLVTAFYPTLAVITGTLESEEVLSSASLPEE